jgi:3-oxoacyl-[acyl-carrier protein] reductase
VTQHAADRFHRKVAIVTGAGRGIGEAYAKSLASAGASVAIADIDADNGERVATEIRRVGGAALAVPTDVSASDSVHNMVNAVSNAFGGIDYLVNNAGLFGDREPWDPMTGDIASWDRTFAINATSVLLCTRAVVPHMVRRGGGAIVNQSSVAAFRASAARLPYAVTKMAVVTLTYAFAGLLGPKGIRVNVICPGLVETEGYQKQMSYRSNDSEQIAALPLARRGVPADLTAGLMYLLSDDSSYMTGQCLQIDGGMMMRY